MSDDTAKPQWWTTLPGILTGITGLITALAGLIAVLNGIGIFKHASSVVHDEPPAATAMDVREIEPKLQAVNITLSTGTTDDIARVRGYFTGPTAPYQLLALACLQILDGRRLKQTGYLDMVDKWYVAQVGEDHYLSVDGNVDLDKVKKAIVAANNEYNGETATALEQILQ